MCARAYMCVCARVCVCVCVHVCVCVCVWLCCDTHARTHAQVGFIPEHEAAGYDAVQHSACSLSPIGPGELGLEGRGEGGLDNVEAQLSRLTLCDAAQHGVGGGLEGGASGRQRMLPIVKFQGGRKEVIVPEVFEQVR